MRKLLTISNGVLIFIGLVLSACSQNSSKQTVDPVSLPDNVESYCTDSIQVTDGIYVYDNNVWGADKNLPYKQCILKKEENGIKKYGWQWDFQGKAPNWVFSYPEVIVGWKPWDQQVPSHPAYPARIADIKTLTITYDVTIEASGDYNLAPEIWLIREKPDSYPIESPENLITTEIMFWMDYTSNARPAGNKVADIEFDGKTYALWLRKDHNNSGDTVSWTVYSLLSPDKQHKGTIDVIGLIRTLAEHGYAIDPKEYVATVEFGNEVLGVHSGAHSKGRTWINDYSVEIETK